MLNINIKALIIKVLLYFNFVNIANLRLMNIFLFKIIHCLIFNK